MERDVRVAYHEAGHAVALIQNRRKFKWVTIDSDSEFEGHVWVSGGVSTPAQEILFLMAGYAANVKIDPEAEALIRAGSRDDFKTVDEKWIHYVHNPDRTDWIAQAGEFVTANWNLIEAVAGALLQRRTLTGEEVELVVRKIKPEIGV